MDLGRGKHEQVFEWFAAPARRERTERIRDDSAVRISEQAVFRWVVIVVVAAASVIALTLLAGSLVGALWGLILVSAAAWHGYRWIMRKRREL